MKILSISILAFSSIFGLSAQGTFKNIPPAKPSGEIKPFERPAGYLSKIKQNATEEAVSFSAQSFYSPVNGLEVKARGKEGRVLLIESNQNYPHQRSSSIEVQANEFLDNASTYLGMDKASESFEIKTQNTDAVGITHIKMQQVYDGIEVYGGEVILHAKDGVIQSLNGRYLNQPEELNTKPSISIEQAKVDIVEAVGISEVNNDPFGLFDFDKLVSKLVVYTDEAGQQSLAYHHTIYKTIIDRWEYFTDAHTGEEIHGHSSICKFHNHEHDHNSEANMPPPDGPVVSISQDLFGLNQQINSYNVSDQFYMIDASRDMFRGSLSNMPDEPVGVVWTIDAFNTSVQNDNFRYGHVTSSTNSFSGKQTAVSAHVNGGIAFQYFRDVHNRNAINGSGGNIVSLINITEEDGGAMDNAFWNGQAMFYGNGSQAFRPLARALDVAGHEMTHGVVQATAALQYQGESGALNESFADVFGAMMDRDDWLIGEDVVTSLFPSGALRSLQDPHNGGNSLNDNGWQPRHVNEQFTGSQDNGGVHINSGIANYAFFLFANQIGKDKAEKVYYQALTNYMTKSSQFVDARIAVVQAATDLYGQAEIDAAKNAWNMVGVGESAGGDYETDVEINPGQDFVIYADANRSKLVLANVLTNGEANIIADPISSIGPLSRPSVSDDGSLIIFVGTDNQIHLISIDWAAGEFTNSVFNDQPVWRNVIISKDGRRIAASTTDNDNRIVVYDAVVDQNVTYELYNPTFTQGVNGGDVLYSDAMEFDITGQFILYDALNRLQGTSGEIEFWDIGVLEVWNNANNGFALGEVEKIFSGLSEGESVGNATFSKNSDYIIAFDYVQNGNIFNLLGANIERGDIGLLYENGGPSYPSYSTQDNRIVHDLALFGSLDVGVLNVRDSKIETVPNSQDIFIPNSRWGVWFSNGLRQLVDIEELVSGKESFELSPNPTSDFVTITIELSKNIDANINVSDINGKLLMSESTTFTNGVNTHQVNLSELNTGVYIITVSTASGVLSKQVVKVN